jgi:hypothetical protein
MKELRFHPQYRTLLFTTAADSFNIFRPNLEPEEEEESKGNTLIEEETKQESTNSSATSKPIKEKKSNQDVWVDSDEDEEGEERRAR